jgi:DNA-binding response OmpR family regulator
MDEKILVVDDDQMIRHLIKLILNEAGYEVWDA